MKGLIRAALAATALALVWSTLWFQEDGVAVFVPGVGGYFFAYGGQ